MFNIYALWFKVEFSLFFSDTYCGPLFNINGHLNNPKVRELNE